MFDPAEFQAIRKKLGKDLLILAHHYQRAEVVALGDIIGDSLALSREAANSDAKYIVFAGVRFMGETAAMLAGPGQEVYMPEPGAGCPLADMAPVGTVKHAFDAIGEIHGVQPLIVTYINTNTDVKALAGSTGGIVCTSGNAVNILKWALEQKRPVLFVSDQNLGENAARRLGLDEGSVTKLSATGKVDAAVARAKLILWDGYCPVHTFFTPEMVKNARKDYPGCKIIVHPEAKREVVDLADEWGSTSAIVRFIDDAGPGSTVVVGTEVDMVTRFAAKYKDRRVIPLTPSRCPNMWATTPSKVLTVIRDFPQTHRITVPESIAMDARKALDRMFQVPA